MKNKLLSVLMIIVMIMSLGLLFTNESNAANADPGYFFAGDIRTVYMVGTDYEGCSLKLTGMAQEKFSGNIKASYSSKKADYLTFFPTDVSERENNEKIMEKEFTNAEKGSKVISWLGLMDLADTNVNPESRASSYAERYVEIANKYKDIEFYIVSVTAVNESTNYTRYLKGMTNDRIDEFNKKMQSEIENAKVDNLKYVDINTEIRDEIINDKTNVRKGYIYNKELCVKISNLIYEKVNTATSGKVIVSETLEVDLTAETDKRFFFPEGYLVKKSDTELKIAKDYRNQKQPILLTGNISKIRFIIAKEYKLGKQQYYQAYYIEKNGNEIEGYVNVEVYKKGKNQQSNNNVNVKEIKVNYSKAIAKHYFYPDTYLTVKTGTTTLTHVANSTDKPTILDGTKTTKFYTDTTYTLKTKNGTYNMYKVEIEGKAGFINAKFLTNTKLHE